MSNNRSSDFASDALMRRFVNDAQNTHDSIHAKSVGMALRTLQQNYFPNRDEKTLQTDMDRAADYCVEKLKILMEITEDSELTRAIAYLLVKIKEPLNTLDAVALYLPYDEKVHGPRNNLFLIEFDNKEYVHIINSFKLKHVVMLVWKALNDDKQYKQHYANESDQEKARIEHRQARLQRFYNTLKELNDGGQRCHLGIRHLLVSVLDKSYPGIELIYDARIFVATFLLDYFTQQFGDLFRSSPAEINKLMTAFFHWVHKSTLRPMLQMVEEVKTEPHPLKTLQQHVIRQGCHPKEIVRFFEEAVDNMHFRFHPDHFKKIDEATVSKLAIIVHILQANQDKDNPVKNAAIASIQNIIVETPYEFNNEQQQKIAKCFFAICEIDRLIKKNALKLKISGNWDDSVDNMLVTTANWFKQLNNSNQLSDVLVNLEKSADVLYVTYVTLKENLANITNSIFKEIERWFDNWFKFKRDDVEFREKFLQKRKHCFQLLMDPDTRNLIVIKEGDVQKLLQSVIEQGAPLALYERNRIFLHAIITSPYDWNESFVILLKIAIQSLIFKPANTQSRFLTGELTQQLEYLISVYEDKPKDRPHFMILLPDQAKDMFEWIWILEYQGENALDTFRSYKLAIFWAFKREITEGKFDYYRQPTLLKQAIKAIPEDDSKIKFLQMLGSEWIKKIVNDDETLLTILEALPPSSRMEFLAQIGHDKLKKIIKDIAHDPGKFVVKYDGAIIIRVLKSLSENEAAKFLLLFDSQFLRSRIYTPNCLGQVLKMIPFNHWDDLLENLSETSPYESQPLEQKKDKGILLPNFINHGSDIYGILQELPEAKQAAFLELFADEDLCEMIEHVQQWIDILTSTSLVLQEELLNRLGNDWLIQLIKKPIELGKLLKAIPENNWDQLLSRLGNLKINQLISSATHLENLLKEIPQEKHEALLTRLGKDRLAFIMENTDPTPLLHYRAILATLDPKKLLALIQNGEQLGIVLNQTPEEKRSYFLKQFDIQKLRVLVQDKDQFNKILQLIPKSEHIDFLEQFQPNLREIIRNGKQIISIAGNIYLIKHLENSVSFEFFKDISNIWKILLDLSPKDAGVFLLEFATNLNGIVTTGDQLAKLLCCFPKQGQAQGEFLKKFTDNKLIDCIGSSAELDRILTSLNSELWLFLFKKLDNEKMLYAIDDSLFNRILNTLSENERDAFLNLFVQTERQLIMMLKRVSHSTATFDNFLSHFGNNKLAGLIQNHEQLIKVLQALPNDIYRNIFLQHLGNDNLLQIFQKLTQVKEVSCTFTQEANRKDFLMRFDTVALNFFASKTLIKVSALRKELNKYESSSLLGLFGLNKKQPRSPEISDLHKLLENKPDDASVKVKDILDTLKKSSHHYNLFVDPSAQSNLTGTDELIVRLRNILYFKF